MGLCRTPAGSVHCASHTQPESFVCLDSGGRALRPANLWLDGRAHEEIAKLGSTRVHEVSGKPPDTTQAIYKLVCVSRHAPDVLPKRSRSVTPRRTWLGD